MTEKPRIDRPIVVEGKYDKIKLDSLFDATVIVTDGFGIFKDKAKQQYLRTLAEGHGLITATDPDGAGLVIRGFLSGIIPKDRIVHILIPPTPGKERRKDRPSKEGTLGLEGIDSDVLRRLFEPYFVTAESRKIDPITTADLYDDGLVGAESSKELRIELAKILDLPTNLSSASLIDAVNLLGGRDVYNDAIATLAKRGRKEQKE